MQFSRGKWKLANITNQHMIKTIFRNTWKPTVKAIWIPTRLTSRVVCGGNTCEGAGEIYNEIYMILWFNQMAQHTINIPPLLEAPKTCGGVYFMRSGEIFLRNFLSYTPLKYSRAKGGRSININPFWFISTAPPSAHWWLQRARRDQQRSVDSSSWRGESCESPAKSASRGFSFQLAQQYRDL